MNQVEQVQSINSLPGGNGRYLDTVYEFLAWLETRAATTREDAFGWFGERFNALKSAPTYPPVLRDLGVVELDRGRDGAIRLTEMGRTLLGTERSAGARIIAEWLLARFVATREILSLFAASDRPLGLEEVRRMLSPRFPSWTSPYQFDFRLTWFHSLGLLKPIKGRVFVMTELGRELADKYPPEAGPSGPRIATVPAVPERAPNPLDSLLSELRAASTDSAKPTRFEAALARAFEWLGFTVQQLGASGDTDVLVEAPIGVEAYSVVVDAKARGSGKVDQLEVLSLKDHQAGNRADHAVVIAAGLAGGKVSSHAHEQGISLLPLAVLEEWLRLHDAWPQDLLAYRSIFRINGLIEKLPADFLHIASDRKRWGKLLGDVVELFGETYENGLTEPLSPREVFKMLVTRQRGVRYPEKDVASTMDLLSHPVVGALARSGDGYILAMSRETLALRLKRLAEEVVNQDMDEAMP